MSDVRPISNSEFSTITRAIRPHTAKFIPWDLVAYFAFKEKDRAAAFEKYLKSGSAGRSQTPPLLVD